MSLLLPLLLPLLPPLCLPRRLRRHRLHHHHHRRRRRRREWEKGITLCLFRCLLPSSPRRSVRLQTDWWRSARIAAAQRVNSSAVLLLTFRSVSRRWEKERKWEVFYHQTSKRRRRVLRSRVIFVPFFHAAIGTTAFDVRFLIIVPFSRSFNTKIS